MVASFFCPAKCGRATTQAGNRRRPASHPVFSPLYGMARPYPSSPPSGDRSLSTLPASEVNLIWAEAPTPTRRSSCFICWTAPTGRCCRDLLPVLAYPRPRSLHIPLYDIGRTAASVGTVACRTPIHTLPHERHAAHGTHNPPPPGQVRLMSSVIPRPAVQRCAVGSPTASMAYCVRRRVAAPTDGCRAGRC